LDAVDGSVLLERNVGEPVSAGDLHCTKFDPMGITGTPVIDLGLRALFFDAMVTPDGGATKKHFIFSLSVDTLEINAGWPVDVEASVSYNGLNFTAETQQQRPALAIVGGILYVGYGSMRDCPTYYGWLVGVPISDPASVMAWAAGGGSSYGGAIWGVGGVASDGKNPFVTTGNTFDTGGQWSGGEAVIRFQPGPIFSGDPADYWVPANWQSLDQTDWDLGSSGPLLVDVPGATPSRLIVAMGKDGNAYLLNRDELGGISAPLAWAHLAGGIIQAAATYRTKQGTFVALRANIQSAYLSAFRITATSPPNIGSGWSAPNNNGGCGPPFVTSTDGASDMVVWVVGTQDPLTPGDQRLHAYDGDTGAVVFSGGGANELMAGTHSYSTTGIVARGRIYVAGDNKVFAFAVPTPTPTPTPTATPETTPRRATPTPRPHPSPRPRPTLRQERPGSI
ncbi:MAG: hypothetical protein IRY93_00810, partial [Chthoniobacterales bacterium]|nr:hypothetical protein [Chthoniobacterales bacterium]